MEQSYQVNRTEDYGMFKRLRGNRAVAANRLKKIRESVRKVGYVPNPIIVNEHMQIIDGQGRYEVCKEFKLPILYIVAPGTGINECIAMNISSTNWTMWDYVNTYIEDGNENYVRLKALADSHKVSLSVAVCAATGLMTTNNESVCDGTFVLDEERYSFVDAMLDYVDSFDELVKANGVSDSVMLKMALCFCYQHPDIDNAILREAFKKYGHRMKSVHKSGDVFECLTDIYNHRRKTNRVYIATKYYEYMDAKYTWYGSKWGSAKRAEVRDGCE